MHYVTTIFLKIEERARTFFARLPFIHAFLAGVGIILVWRGVWETADRLGIMPLASIAIGVVLLVAIGLYLQTLVGNTIIINEVKKDKEMTRRTEREIKVEEITMEVLAARLEMISAKLDSLTK
jgi:hypothetical protein